MHDKKIPLYAKYFYCHVIFVFKSLAVKESHLNATEEHNYRCTLNNFSNWSLNKKWKSFRIIKLINKKSVEQRSTVYFESVGKCFDKIMS